MILLIDSFIVFILLSLLVIPFVKKTNWKGISTLFSVFVIAALSSVPAINALMGNPTEITLIGSYITHDIPLRIDALSGFFILTINFTFITGVIYGIKYMQAYSNQSANLSLHWFCYILTFSSLISVCVIQNGLVFLIAWEIMALSTFVLVIFEHNKQQTLKAGISYLIQSHVIILFLTLAFIWVYLKTNSYDFNSIRDFSLTQPVSASMALMVCFFFGFAIKAGFVPFHTWLPLAHPAAPSHISGIMSGVIIKIGIYGIFRMILLIKTDYLAFGYFILIVSVITGIYGVMLAIVQHNLKRLLAYHSIENIGIIGIGIGLGCIGMGNGNKTLAILGLLGALLHTLNHSLFKSLLFYTAGNVYQSTHTLEIDHLGGAGKQMQHTSLLFLIAALAICGFPPFNGFVSEFLIYSGLFNGLKGASLPYLSCLAISIFGLSIIGGLAMLCFTKAYGTIFLGTPRNNRFCPPKEKFSLRLIPMYIVAILIVTIGIFPKAFFNILIQPVHQFTSFMGDGLVSVRPETVSIVSKVGYTSAGFILLAGVLLLIRYKIATTMKAVTGPTWGCGYTAPTARIQYTASSFIRNYRKLAEPLLLIHKYKKDVSGTFPGTAWHETNPEDKIEENLILRPIRRLRNFLGGFSFLQNGRPQIYVLYGAVFITLIISVPLLIDLVRTLVQFLNTM